MLTGTEQKKAAVDAIRQQIKIFNLITMLVVYSLLFVIVKFLFVILDYIPTPSLVAIVSIVAGLIVAGMYVVNVTSSKALRQIDEYTTKLNTLLNTTRDIRETEYSDVLLANIMDSSLRLTGSDAGSILLIEGEQLVFKIIRGPESGRLTGLSIPLSGGIAGWAVEHRSAVRTDAAQQDPRFDPRIDRVTGYETKSVLCVPLISNAGPIGVLEMINKKAGVFTDEDEAIISYFADQAAIAISRAKFYEDQKNYEINLTDILINTMDNYMREKSGHSRRVARYSLLIARALNLTDGGMKRLYRACLLHDIGFLRIRMQTITSKEQFRAHSALGYEMLRPINFYADIAPIVLHHHERYDGGGYPAGLKGEAIPLESRIIAIAEAFDAMVSKESYKYAGELADNENNTSFPRFHYAMQELQNNAGTQFDPELVGIFANNIDETSLEEACDFSAEESRAAERNTRQLY